MRSDFGLVQRDSYADCYNGGSHQGPLSRRVLALSPFSTFCGLLLCCRTQCLPSIVSENKGKEQRARINALYSSAVKSWGHVKMRERVGAGWHAVLAPLHLGIAHANQRECNSKACLSEPVISCSINPSFESLSSR